MRYELKNELITVGFDTMGAEMTYLNANETGQEYLWNADERYWDRSSPVLFPFVGRTKNLQYEYNGGTYSMTQHGFARDMEFECIFENSNEIWFRLEAGPGTQKNYPFDFVLEIGYYIEGYTVKVMWKVVNAGLNDMYFSIGAHPAFLCPLKDGERQSDYSIWMNARDDGALFSLPDRESGLVKNFKNELKLSKGRHILEEGFFDQGAYIIEDYQVNKISLVDPENRPYITVSFQAPVVGLWSPEKKNAPFVCIEPWYGRGDRETFSGTLQTREWGNKLKPKEIFDASYTIAIEKAP